MVSIWKAHSSRRHAWALGLILLPIMLSGRQKMMADVLGETWMESLTCGFSLAKSWLLRHSGRVDQQVEELPQ